MKMNEKYFNSRVKEGFSKSDFVNIDKEKLLEKAQDGTLKKYWDDIKNLYELVKDYFAGNYRDVSAMSITTVIGTLVYIFSPLDLCPDFIPVIGLIDDAICLRFCLSTVHNEIEKYKIWKNNPIIDV